MDEIVASRMCEAHVLRRLFSKFVALAPLHDKHLVEHVVSDLRLELGVV